MYEGLYQDLERGVWAETNPFACPCRGNGWFLSDLDTWHRCPIHGHGVPHPEDEQPFDFGAHRLEVARVAFAQFRTAARQAGFTDNFSKECWALLDTDQPTAQDWLRVAEQFTNHLYSTQADERARQAGFSCALEQRWTEDAEQERCG